jgi:hypothetical protein
VCRLAADYPMWSPRDPMMWPWPLQLSKVLR